MRHQSESEVQLQHSVLLEPATALALGDIELVGIEDLDMRPGRVREVILAQHEQIRGLLDKLDRNATHLMAMAVPSDSAREGTRQLALVLCLVLVSHIEFENRVLTAALEALDASGPLRAERLRSDHAEQLLLLGAYSDALEHDAGSGAELALSAWQLVSLIREDMRYEEATMLGPWCSPT
jgi:hypothetical protein